MISRWPVLWAMVALLLATGCGFHPPHKTASKCALHVVMKERDDCLMEALASRFMRPMPDEAAPILFIEHVHWSTLPLSYNSFNQVYHKRLQLEVTYHLQKADGTMWAPTATVFATREQQMKDNVPLSAEIEHGMLARGMCQDVVSNLMLQFSHLP